jgi:hypothetical protein
MGPSDLAAYDARSRRRSRRNSAPFTSAARALIALLHRLGLEYHKADVIPRKLDEAKQKAFIEAYEKLLNHLGCDEAVLFVDAVHPTDAARPIGCCAAKGEARDDRADEWPSAHQHSRRN